MKRILVVDDEKMIVKGIKYALNQDGYDVVAAYDGEEALKLFKEQSFDLCILDLMLPEINGYDVCTEIREASDMPIIMLTAKDQDMDKIMGLEYGADDYMTKPFNILELKARIKAILRRTSAQRTDNASRAQDGQVLTFGNMKIDRYNKRVLLDGNDAMLTSKEFDILFLLASNPDRTYDREQLMREVWEEEVFFDTRTVDVHIRRLREKIEKDPGNPVYIHTKWGIGYYFHVE